MDLTIILFKMPNFEDEKILYWHDDSTFNPQF